jgi:hypothetical protein
MLNGGNGPLTYIRFGIQRKKDFLKDVCNAYDGLVLPANILLYQYRSTPSVILMCGKPFAIDPMSYLFGEPYENFKQKAKNGPQFKPSFRKLMEGHGLGQTDFLNIDYRSLLKFLSDSPKNVSTFVDNAFDFQLNQVWNVLQEASDLVDDKQKAFLTEKNCRPVILIPPYFLYSQNAVTTELNKRILKYCWDEKRELGDIFPMIFLTKETLSMPFVNEIIEIAKTHDFPGYSIWIESFDERTAKKEQISGLIRLTSALSENNKQIFMLYGGFFSLLLYHFGMTCVSHGLAYGEARSIGATAQQGTGPAPIRYYLLELHRFLTLDDALEILRQRPDLICTCPICKRILAGNPEKVTLFQNEESLAEMHFLYNRNQERKMIATSTLSDIVSHLEWIYDLNEDIEKITKNYRVGKEIQSRSIVDLTYIREWKEALEDVLSK